MKSSNPSDEELYLLQDGTYEESGDCSKGDDGVLRGANGLAVCLDAEGQPMTAKHIAEKGGAATAAAAGRPAKPEAAATEPAAERARAPAGPAASAKADDAASEKAS